MKKGDDHMCQIALEIPNEVLYDTKMSKEESASFARRSVAFCYYVQNGVSLGYCAKIAGMSKEKFIRFLGDNKVSVFHYDDEDEFLEELNNA